MQMNLQIFFCSSMGSSETFPAKLFSPRLWSLSEKRELAPQKQMPWQEERMEWKGLAARLLKIS